MYKDQRQLCEHLRGAHLSPETI